MEVGQSITLIEKSRSKGDTNSQPPSTFLLCRSIIADCRHQSQRRSRLYSKTHEVSQTVRVTCCCRVSVRNDLYCVPQLGNSSADVPKRNRYPQMLSNVFNYLIQLSQYPEVRKPRKQYLGGYWFDKSFLSPLHWVDSRHCLPEASLSIMWK